ncbi:transcriptional regulator [Thermoanaerobacterium phage THSA-485A]|uniref:transcriptional regulator n=1 Tax=Thermoanaerobacterium phage THSA-485A TaxID=1126885 RepID=UPI000263F8EB|nr:transcriptional regulator [Thermoanaerobacterium phage THSA-485A]AFK87736.1 transcriptional regulator, XRE family [Thermoanaerobacterium phage THSA-485A]
MINERLKKIRKEQGLSLRALAEKSGISKSTLNDIENGKSNPTTETLAKIAKALNIKMSDLFRTENDSENDPDLEFIDEYALSLDGEKEKFPKVTDVKEALKIIMAQPGLMLNGELLSDESKIALANAIQMGLAYAERMQKKEKGNKKQ